MVWYRQEPALLSPSYVGRIRFADFTVVGDVTDVRFSRTDADTGAPIIETWSRVRTDTIGARLVSVFEPSWDEATVRTIIRHLDFGFDQPYASIGRYLGPDDGEDQGVRLVLRTSLSEIPLTHVVQVDETVQYASHVVNIVLPSFGLARIGDAWGFDLTEAARKFYATFEDSYEVLSFIPELIHPATEYGAYHERAQNPVRGIGMSRFSATSRYGSNGVLLGAELFGTGRFGSNETANHELTHTWGHEFDWASITGLPLTPDPHTPLMTGGESFVGIILEPYQRVGGSDDAPIIERTPVYGRQHPLELYAMGVLPATEVPPMRLFANQEQFAATGVTIGAPVDPAGRAVTIDDVIRLHGPREGPVYTELRRAAVVVSRDRLLTPQEMAHWNYLAARQEDANRTGMFDYFGQPSFDFTTGQRVDLRTSIRPRDAAPAASAYALDFPAFSRRDCAGIEFDAPVASRYAVGQRVTLSGRITASDRSDFDRVLFRYWLSGGGSDRAVRVQTDVSRSGLFSVQLEFREGQEGMYAFEGFLFWPDAPAQWPRCSLSPVTVTSASPSPTAAR